MSLIRIRAAEGDIDARLDLIDCSAVGSINCRLGNPHTKQALTLLVFDEAALH